MALVVEDGSGSNADANSFADLATIKAFASARGIVLPADADVEVAAIKAMDWITSKEDAMNGSRVSQAQPLCYPRKNVKLFGFDVLETEIPEQLVRAQCQATCDAANGIELMPNMTGPAIKREKVGPLETEYAVSNGTTNEPILSAANALLKPLLGIGAMGLKNTRA